MKLKEPKFDRMPASNAKTNRPPRRADLPSASVIALLVSLILAAGARAEMTLSLAREFFPEATRLAAQGMAPPAWAVLRGDELVGYLISTDDVVASKGYSGKPLDIVVALGLDGVIAGARIIEHHEPILIIGVSDRDLARFVEQFRGRDIRAPISVSRGVIEGDIDAVAGATVSSIVMNDAVLRAARAVAASRGLLGVASSRIDFATFDPATWSDLLEEGSLVTLRVSVGEATAALARRGGRLYPANADPPADDAALLDLAFGLATPARVGRNLLGDKLYNNAMGALAVGDQWLFIAGRGAGSFKGRAWRKTGVFDRLQIVQSARTIVLRTDGFRSLNELAVAGAPEFRDAVLIRIPAETGFDPAVPWRLEVLVPAAAPDETTALAIFGADYELPARYRRAPMGQEDAANNLWIEAWHGRALDIAMLSLALAALSTILVFQDWLARRRRLYHVVRISFLSFTLIWIGWYAAAQLSVLNVLTFAEAVRTEFRWSFFLLDPLLFILWGYVAVTLLFWGRGVFCGWLCPFGALQELTNRLAQWAKVPQLNIPFAVNERLWPIKYIVFLGLFALSLSSLPQMQQLIEVEPFKTAIVLRFDREWYFVAYAGVLIGIGLFVQRAFCRYLCPLGAALAIPARLRTFDWLKRRWQCGVQCHRCANKCPVQAIYPDGKISPNECVYCLHCQVQYHDDHVCPPLIERRKRREGIAARRAAIGESGGQ